jgi:outer membrane protein OmpA-like peptidoglycan-associated protein
MNSKRIQTIENTSGPVTQRGIDQRFELVRAASMRLVAFGGIALMLSAPTLMAACSRFGWHDASARMSAASAASQEEATPVRGEKVTLEGVKFSPDGSTIRPESKPILDSAAAMLKSEPDKKVYVDSYCNPIGGKRTNLLVSEQRATAVTAYLEKKGISPKRLTARGFGATDFVASNRTAAGRAQNHRIELVLSD